VTDAYALLEEPLASVADSALAETCRGREYEIVALGRGNRKRTFLVSLTDGGRFVLQLCAERRWLRTEVAVLRGLREQTAVPVPAVRAAGTASGVAYAVTDHVAGEDLHERFVALDDATQTRLADRFGAHLAEVHGAFRFEGYGEVTVEEGALVASGEDWPRWLRGYARRAIGRLPDELDGLRDDLVALVERAPLEPEPPARLFPWDFRPGNALVDDGTLAAILDWEAPLAADPALSFAKAEYLVADWYVERSEPLRRAFRQGYSRVRDLPAVASIHRVAAIADTAVDSRGQVTNPGYPELPRAEAVAFHRRALAEWS